LIQKLTRVQGLCQYFSVIQRVGWENLRVSGQ
jgi:hypothetical protein